MGLTELDDGQWRLGRAGHAAGALRPTRSPKGVSGRFTSSCESFWCRQLGGGAHLLANWRWRLWCSGGGGAEIKGVDSALNRRGGRGPWRVDHERSLMGSLGRRRDGVPANSAAGELDRDSRWRGSARKMGGTKKLTGGPGLAEREGREKVRRPVGPEGQREWEGGWRAGESGRRPVWWVLFVSERGGGRGGG